MALLGVARAVAGVESIFVFCEPDVVESNCTDLATPRATFTDMACPMPVITPLNIGTQVQKPSQRSKQKITSLAAHKVHVKHPAVAPTVC
eukprot:scaffold5999_cov114-Skeletonema_dohrnii-CCMP3373.AAC.7